MQIELILQNDFFSFPLLSKPSSVLFLSFKDNNSKKEGNREDFFNACVCLCVWVFKIMFWLKDYIYVNQVSTTLGG